MDNSIKKEIKHNDNGDKSINYFNNKGINLINDYTFVLNIDGGNIVVKNYDIDYLIYNFMNLK